VNLDDIRFVNLTPHDVCIWRGEGRSVLTIPPVCDQQGFPEPARVQFRDVLVGNVPYGNGVVPIRYTILSPASGIPAPRPNTIYIVSKMTARAARRPDVLYPGTDPFDKPIRHPVSGKVHAVRCLRQIRHSTLDN